MNFLKITLAALTVMIILGCQNDPIELSIEQPSGSMLSLALQETALSSLPVIDKYVQVAAGTFYTIALKSDGTLWAWGLNGSGQLGDGTVIDKLTPIQIGSDTNWKSVSASTPYYVDVQNHVLALKTDGTLWAWGANNDGELGDGTNSDHLTPIQIGSDTNWKTISAGGNFSLAIKTDGTLWSWGRNNVGQLGQNNISSLSSPKQVGTDTWVSIQAASNYSVAIKSDATLWAWGRNNNGQLGDNTTVDRLTPTQEFRGDTDWKSISATGVSTLAIKDNGSLWAWGYNVYGQLGDSTINTRIQPNQIAIGTTWKYVGTGFHHTAAIKSDGTLWNWGRNPRGELANGTATTNDPNPTPTQLGSETNWESFSGGEGLSAAIKSDGSLWTSGWNDYGQVGDGTVDDSLVFLKMGMGASWQSISAGYTNSVAIKTNGSLWAWGRNQNGQIGDGTTVSRFSPVQVGSDKTWKTARTGGSHSVAIASDDSLWAWGSNLYGQLGDGSTTKRTLPVAIASGSTWKELSIRHHTIAIKSDNTLWAWGLNTSSQLGDGSTANRSSPVPIAGVATWKSISASFTHNVGIQTDGSLWAWGANGSGQLGDSSVITRSIPVKIGVDTTWKSISAGGSHTLALKTDGTLWAWGLNSSGQLGDGTITNRLSPIQIGSETTWQSVSAGDTYSIALKTDGSLWVWGKSDYGALASGATTQSLTPLQVGSDTTWSIIHSGTSHALALKANGTFWCWGYNGYGQLGLDSGEQYTSSPTYVGIQKQYNVTDYVYGHYTLGLNGLGEIYAQGFNRYGQLGMGDTTTRTELVKVDSLDKWAQISLGKEHAAGVQSNGTLWTWGNNQHKELGYSTTDTFKPFSTQINGDTDWEKVICGDKFTVALKTDGTLWVWGDNSAGQLGLGILSLDPLVPTPVQVGTKTHWTDIVAYKDALYVQKSDGTIWGAGNLIYFGLLK